MRTGIRRTLAVPMLAAAALFGGGSAATAVDAPSAPAPSVPAPGDAAQASTPPEADEPRGVITADGQPSSNADYRQDLAATVSFPEADPTYPDYVQFYVNGQPSGPVVPLQEDGTVTVPLYMSMGTHFVGATLIEDGFYPTDSAQIPGFSVTAPLPGEEGSPAVPVQ